MNKLYWYEMVQRPASPGAQPKGIVERDDDKGRWGLVAYDHELSKSQLEEYEMRVWIQKKNI